MFNSVLMERNHTIKCQQLKQCWCHVPSEYFVHWVKFQKGRFHITCSSIQKEKKLPCICKSNKKFAQEKFGKENKYSILDNFMTLLRFAFRLIDILIIKYKLRTFSAHLIYNFALSRKKINHRKTDVLKRVYWFSWERHANATANKMYFAKHASTSLKVTFKSGCKLFCGTAV